MKNENATLVYTTKEGIKIFTVRGKKPQSKFDFVVKYFDPRYQRSERVLRTPRHIHPIVEMYVKQAYEPKLTEKLRLHLLKIFRHIKPINYYSPRLQFFKPVHAARFKKLDKVGEFSAEFFLVVSELIMIQEKTNYP